VDFRDIGVREFGVIYEGLLESELSQADRDLTLNDGQYVPADEDTDEEDVVVEAGEVYLHGLSGERKATGTYYTKSTFVEHLLDHSLEPALEDHLAELDEMSDAEAATNFFDFRVADVAMGSGHFLVGAVDRIEKAFSDYLAERQLARVENELETLRTEAKEKFAHTDAEPEIERDQVLRRQIARRCVYGVDLNPLATELARLSLWIHTFVPGLPLTFLDYNLRTGDALVGAGTLEEMSDVMGVSRNQVTFNSFTSEKGFLDEIEAKLEKTRNIADDSAEKVREARKTREQIQERLAPVEARLDILTAANIDEEINVSAATNTDIGDPRELSTYEESQELLEPFDVLHFPTTFPEVFHGDRAGFDVVIGNPPWDKVRFEAQQYWVTRHPGLNTVPATRRDDRIEELRERYPAQAQEEKRQREQREAYQEYVGNAFDDQGRGHHDYSKLFVERATDLQNHRGQLGYVLPRQSLVLSGWKQLRRRLVEDAETTVLQLRNTGGWVFENVHKSYMMVLITSAPSDETVARIWPAIESRRAFEQITMDDTVTLSHADLASLTDENRLVVPWFNDQGAQQVYPKMEQRPRLAEDDGWVTGVHDSRWDFTGSGPHSDLSNSEHEPGYWRVFMTRSADQFEINEDKQFRRFVDPQELHREGEDLIESNGEIKLAQEHPTVTFRYVTMNDNTRTQIATMLPESGFIYCKGYVHAVDHEPETTVREQLALLSYLNSFTCDWWLRRIVDRHVNAPMTNNLPLPDWTDDGITEAAMAAAELTRRGGIETLPGGRDVPSDTGFEDDSESEIRRRIEALTASGFGLGRREIETVLSDFTEEACSDALREEIEGVVSESARGEISAEE
jgi:hypothetical protein